ncbi:LysR family transcriptional regulator [Sorangium sp. So ce134]
MPFSTTSLSRKFSDTAETRTRISPGPGAGIGASASLNLSRPTASITQRFIVFSISRSLALPRRRDHRGAPPSVVVMIDPLTGAARSTIAGLMSDRFNGIAVFVEAAEAGTFALAAARLGLTRSAVAKTIGRIEGRLGVRLFHRTTRSQSLTADGQLYYERCQRALRELEAAEAALDSGRREPAGRLRVCVPVLFGRRCVAPILLDIAAEHARLELELSFSDQPVDLVENGFDLAVRNGPLPDQAGLVGRRLVGQRMSVCASPSYLAARGRPETIEALAAHDTIAYGCSGRVKDWCFRDAEGRLRGIPIRSRIRYDDLEAVADASAAGLGLAWLPWWLIRDRVRRGELECVLTDVPGLLYETHAIWPQAPQMPSRVRVAIDALVTRLPAMVDV